MNFLKVISVDEAKEKVLSMFAPNVMSGESIDILQAESRILAADIISDCDVPGFDRSVVDGYAVDSRYTFGSSDSLPSLLDCTGSVAMGLSTEAAISGPQTVYVPTGGMMPSGADAVVMIEHAEAIDDSTVAVNKAVRPGENVTLRGDDIRLGQKVLSAGRTLSLWDIGALAAMGVTRADVAVRPKVYVISTGDEIIEPSCQPAPGQIRDINGWALWALAEKSSCTIVGRRIVEDSFDLLRQAIGEAVELADIVLMSGGSSVGTKDYTYDILNSFDGAGVFVNGLAVKPGKPTIVAEIRGKAVFGLPGHPVSAITIYKILVEPLVRQMMGATAEPSYVEAYADSNFHSSPGKETYQLVDLVRKEGRLWAVPVYGKSGLITTLVRASGYVKLGADQEGVYAGQMVRVYGD